MVTISTFIISSDNEYYSGGKHVSRSEKITVPKIIAMKKQKRKIAMITAYDYPTARIVDDAGVDIILVGDSVGMVVLGYSTTIPVTLEEILHHTKAVVRGTRRAMVVADMPFLTYQVSTEEAIRNAGRLIKEGGADAVKIEGGEEVTHIVKALINANIPVMGHIGLTPQRIRILGGYKVQGRTVEDATRLLASAKALEKAGVFSIVLELVTTEVSKIITENVSIPTIGIGAGPYCDGQVLVFHDIVGLFEAFKPKFVKQYVNAREILLNAIKEYTEDVKSGKFPQKEHSFSMKDEEREKLAKLKR